MTLLYWVLGIGGLILANILILLFVDGGAGPGGEEEDARDDYQRYLNYMEGTTSGSSLDDRDL